MKQSFDFYEFTAILVPGTIFLIGYELLANEAQRFTELLPDSLGSLGMYLVIAYGLGHLLQGFGNLIEEITWKIKGKPSDKPISEKTLDKKRVHTIYYLADQKPPKYLTNIRKSDWQKLISETISRVYATNSQGRLHIFAGNYGMLRGLTAAFVLLTPLLALSQKFSLQNLALVGVLIVLSWIRMIKFSSSYANELFACAAILEKKK